MNNQPNESSFAYEAILQQQQQMQVTQNSQFAAFQQQAHNLYQQSQAALFPTTTQIATMPTPTNEPWAINTMPWPLASYTDEQPVGLMEFTANNPHTPADRPHLCAKRRADNTAPFVPKQFITEERITEHFNGLHISSDYIANSNSNVQSRGSYMPTGKCFTNLTYEDYQLTAKDLAEKLKKATRITVCDEMKQLSDGRIQKPASIIPETLLNRVEQPCKALVLWSPPPLPIMELLQSNRNENRRNENLNENESNENLCENGENENVIVNGNLYEDRRNENVYESRRNANLNVGTANANFDDGQRNTNFNAVRRNENVQESRSNEYGRRRNINLYSQIRNENLDDSDGMEEPEPGEIRNRNVNDMYDANNDSMDEQEQEKQDRILFLDPQYLLQNQYLNFDH